MFGYQLANRITPDHLPLGVSFQVWRSRYVCRTEDRICAELSASRVVTLTGPQAPAASLAPGRRSMLFHVPPKADACAMANTGPSPSMQSFVANCYLARGAGIPCWHGSSHEMGILDAVMVHSVAAAPNCTLPSDILSYQRVDDLLVKPIEIRDSYAIVPDTPGLGVELDEDAVKKYAAKE